jgi:hypothetical protein
MNKSLDRIANLYKVKVGQRVNIFLDDGDEVVAFRADVRTGNPLIYFEPDELFLVPREIREGQGKVFAVVDTSNGDFFYRKQHGDKVIKDLDFGKFHGYF